MLKYVRIKQGGSMVTDKFLSQTFQIPTKMLQRWKNSSDYRYLIYSCLKNGKYKNEEDFIEMIQATSHHVTFLYKYEFLSQAKNKRDMILGHGWFEPHFQKITSSSPSYESKEITKFFHPSKSQYYFSLVNDQGDLAYFEISKRIPDTKTLTQKVQEIKKVIEGRYTLKRMYFFIEEKTKNDKEQREPELQDLIIEGINLNDFAKEYLKTNKVIFVPPRMRKPEDTANNKMNSQVTVPNELTEVEMNLSKTGILAKKLEEDCSEDIIAVVESMSMAEINQAIDDAEMELYNGGYEDVDYDEDFENEENIW